jgi:tetratricopeptide (TPR) repeat protein
LGIALKGQGKLDEAVACYRRALELKPDFAEAHNNLGAGLQEQAKLEEAVACYRRALELKPDYAEAHDNLGAALQGQGKLDEAVACHRRAVELRPDQANAWHNMGFAFRRKGDLDEAETCCRKALELKPTFAKCRFNLAALHLLRGDFAQGWPEHESRLLVGNPPAPTFRQPLWDGRPLDGRTILLHAEGGFGDTIQFIRYAPLVKQRGARVIVECQAPLVPWLGGWPTIEKLVAHGEPLPAFDVHAPLLSLPGIFRTSLESIPAQVP